jgi:hypothetical protein
MSANHDYIMTIVDSLSKYARFIPCKKSTTGEQAFPMIFEHWIQVYGRPIEIHSDNDIRFQGPEGWWQGCLKALKIKVTFSTPRRPQANGLCEQTDKKFIQTMRSLMAQQKSPNWLNMIPYCTVVMNNQYLPSTGYTPSDLFFGRPSWQADVTPSPDVNPSASEWLSEQLSMQEIAKKRIQQNRERHLKHANKGRSLAHYQERQYVLVHTGRFPQWPITKLGSQWFGPYRITKEKSQSVEVKASPNLGGVIDVAFIYLKYSPGSFDPTLSDSEDEEMEDEKIEDVEDQMDTEEPKIMPKRSNQPKQDKNDPNETIATRTRKRQKTQGTEVAEGYISPGSYLVESILEHQYHHCWHCAR